MNRKLNVGLSIAAGFFGSFLFHYISPVSLHAQAQSAPEKEVVARSFVLVNAQGAPAGVFGFEKDGSPSIKLFDQTGKVIWFENGKPQILPRTTSASK